MRLIVKRGSGRTLVDVEADPGTTVAQLLVALGASADSDGVSIDGERVIPDDLLDELDLVSGSTVRLDEIPSDHQTDAPMTEVVIVGGPHAGQRAPLVTEHPLSIGRSVDNVVVVDNPSVSARHAVVTGTPDGAIIDDVGSHNGVVVDDVHHDQVRLDGADQSRQVQLGSTAISVRSRHADDRPTGTHPRFAGPGGRILFNRPPRSVLPPTPEPIRRPPAAANRQRPAISIAAIIVPIIFAGVMVLVLGRWQYAIFAALSPVMAIANYLSARRKEKKAQADDAETRAAAMSRIARELIERQQLGSARLRAIGPDLVEVERRVSTPSNRLWERRPADDDAWTCRVGYRRDALVAEFVGSDGRSMDEELDDEVQGLVSELDDLVIPVLVDLADGPLGIVANDTDGAAIARSAILQLIAMHGPADLLLTVITRPERAAQWEWAALVPHTATSAGGTRVLTGDAATAWAVSRLTVGGDKPTHPTDVVIIDDLDLLHRRGSDLRALFELADRSVTGIVLATERDHLPSTVRSVISCSDASGVSMMSDTQTLDESVAFVADMATDEFAWRLAASMARWEDPDVEEAEASLPSAIDASGLFGGAAFDPEMIRQSWGHRSRGDLRGAFGIGSSGVVTLDLVADGPHGLVAGTTGAGKSELLRTWVAGMAIEQSPDDVVFVLVDYKGGAAFDVCADLPHVVGLVTDLDGHLASRALTSLDAELHHRELVLREAGVSGIGDLPLDVTLPRLVVVIDEFATLRAELPEFMAALVGIAQRGRSLGVHMILATQRPSGAVDANIRANTNLRVALRVQDRADSMDVIDDRAAADIPRHRPGRCWVRLGASDLQAVQAGYVSGPKSTGESTVRVAPVPLGSGAPGPSVGTTSVADGPAELSLIVDAITRAADGLPAPRRPWLPDLPTNIDLSTLRHPGDGVALGLADHPAEQAQRPWEWPLDDGHLVVLGALGSGVSTTLGSIAAQLVDHPSSPWVYAVDAGADAFSHAQNGLASIIRPGDGRHERLLTVLRRELERRQVLPSAAIALEPPIFAVIDGVGAFVEAASAGSAEPNGELLARVVRDGPGLGITLVVGAASHGELPRPLRGTSRHALIHQLTDTTDVGAFGLRPKDLPPSLGPGRVVHAPSGVVMHVARPTAPADRGAPPERAPLVDLLAETVGADELPAATIGAALSLPIGIRDDDRGPAVLDLRAGEHALISGPGESGRTTTLRTIARVARGADPALVIVGIGPEAEDHLSPEDGFDAIGAPEGLGAVFELARSDERRWLVLIDDAERIDGVSGLERLIADGRPNVTFVVAGSSSTLRRTYGHWARRLASGGIGVLLQPDPADGELLGARLPRDLEPVHIVGRGHLVGRGVSSVIQVAR